MQALKNFSPLLKIKSATIDNPVFKLHYRFTVIVLLVSAVLVSTKQFFGEPIHCMANKEKTLDAINNYCWIHGIFTLQNPNDDNFDSRNMIEPGVGPYGNNQKQIYHRYYQWVCVTLMVQAILFYLPRYIWKVWEGGQIKALITDLNTAAYPEEKWTESRKISTVRFFTETNGHYFYAIRFAICELLNICNVVFQFIVLNNFLGGSFQNFTPVIKSFFYDPNDPNSVNPMDWIFPKVTKCTFYNFGSSGTLQNMDLICVLPLNVFNEKIFSILWVWLIILFVFSVIAFIYRILTFCCPCIRALAIMSQVRTIPKFQIMDIMMKLNFGDWFLLYQLGRNLNPLVFREIILKLDNHYDKKTALI